MVVAERQFGSQTVLIVDGDPRTTVVLKRTLDGPIFWTAVADGGAYVDQGHTATIEDARKTALTAVSGWRHGKRG